MPENYHPPIDVSNYRDRQEAAGGLCARLDRSKEYRYRTDYPVLTDEAASQLEAGKPLTILDIGVGNMEEPLSYLAAISRASDQAGISLQEASRLAMVDIREAEQIHPTYSRGKMSAGGLGGAFLTDEMKKHEQMIPVKPPQGFESAYRFSSESEEYEYRDDIKNFLKDTVNDKKRSHFGTPIETFLESSDERYHIVACNNVLQHLGGKGIYPTPFKKDTHDDLSQFYSIVEKILDRVEPGGMCIMHTDGADPTDTKGRATKKILEEVPFFHQEFKEVADGIYRRHA